jgi:hypothetical protein
MVYYLTIEKSVATTSLSYSGQLHNCDPVREGVYFFTLILITKRFEFFVRLIGLVLIKITRRLRVFKNNW